MQLTDERAQKRPTLDGDGFGDGSAGVPVTAICRASSVAAELVRRGVLAERLYVAGASSRNPVASNATPEGKAQNRRVEIRIVPVTQADVNG